MHFKVDAFKYFSSLLVFTFQLRIEFRFNNSLCGTVEESALLIFKNNK